MYLIYIESRNAIRDEIPSAIPVRGFTSSVFVVNAALGVPRYIFMSVIGTARAPFPTIDYL